MAILFAVCLITSNFFVPRVWQVGDLPVQLSAPVLLFPVTYVLNDCLTEVYGYRRSRLVIWIAFAMSAFVALMSALVCVLPSPIDAESREVAQKFNSLFMLVPRTTVASLLAFVCGSTFNAFIMSRMKVLSSGRRFGLRAIVSSVGGEVVDSCVFFPVAYWGMMTPESILSLGTMEVCVKVLFEIIVLPLTFTVVKTLKRREGTDVYDVDISYNPFKLSDI